MSDATNIIQKLLAVQKAIEYVKKESDTGVGGKGVARDHLVSKVREKLITAGILVSTSQVGDGSTITVTRKGGENGSFTDTVLYTGIYETSFINVDNPVDRHCVRHAGHGKDSGDKAPGKASTYAEKLNILKALFLETGIADEARNPGDYDEPEPPKALDSERMDAILKAAKATKDKAALDKVYLKAAKAIKTDGCPADLVKVTEACSKHAGVLKEIAAKAAASSAEAKEAELNKDVPQ